MTSFTEVPANAVTEALDGYCRIHHKHVARIGGTNVVVRRDIASDRVALICGGGSGHEPAHVGFVAQQWLTAAVCGDIFASPPTSAITAAIEHIAEAQRRGTPPAAAASGNLPGVLILVKNYTGDVLNFGFAAKEAQARGIPVEVLVLGDDVAFGADHDGRRGIAGTILWYHILGAHAARGATLPELVTLGRAVSSRLRSFGASLSSCTIPGNERNRDIPDGFVELGLGIHGERGMEACPYRGVHHVVDETMKRLFDNVSVDKRHSVVLLLNNLGATSDLEMSVLAHHTLLYLANMPSPVPVARVAVGRWMTALTMHGASWTVLFLPKDDLSFRESVLDALSASTDVIRFAQPAVGPDAASFTVPGPLTVVDSARQHCQQAPSPIGVALQRVLLDLDALYPSFNEMDANVGDGDTGFGVSRACHAASSVVDCLPWEQDPATSCVQLANVVASAFAGSSGPLYGAFLVAAAESLKECDSTAPQRSNCDKLRTAFIAGAAAVSSLGGAHVGERTMFDVLHAVATSPDVLAAQSTKDLLHAAVVAAEVSAVEVRGLRATKGRSRYLGGKEVGLPDPGCEVVVAWLRLLRAEFATLQALT